MIIKKKLLLKGLHCANCATKIERAVQKLNIIEEANYNFNNSTLIINLEETHKDSIIKTIQEIVDRIEPGVKVVDKENLKRTVVHAPVKNSSNLKMQNNKEENLKLDKKENSYEHNHDHSHGHSHDGEDSDELEKKTLIRIISGVVLLILATVLKSKETLSIGLYLTSYVLIGGKVILSSIRNISKGQVFDENFLMAVATVAAIGVKQYPEAVAVMLFYEVGEFLQDKAVNKSRKSITALMNIRPDYANLVRGEDIEVVSPEDINIDDIIMVKPGEKIPLDGIVVEGQSFVDTSAITGESLISEVSKDSNVLSGYINKNGVIKIKVTKTFGESTVSKILELTENASATKANTEKFITKFARYYTPVVVFAALALAVIPTLILKDPDISKWIYRAAVFLVVSCPCALVISIPLSFFAGIGGASKKGVLIKAGTALEALNDADTIVFDKTGTLTKGVFKVSKIDSEEGVNTEELIEYAAYVESYSNHPIAKSILKYYEKTIDNKRIEGYEEIVARGVTAYIDGKKVYAGNNKLMEELNINYKKAQEDGVILYIALEDKYIGYIVINDEIKKDSKETIKSLKDIGIKKAAMLTGDRKSTANNIGTFLGMDEIYSELLPQEKVEKMQSLKSKTSKDGKIVFVGDGVNDAPVLAMSDIGVSMGGLGSDAAIEASDLVLMSDEPSKLVDAIKIARKTHKIVWQNIIIVLIIKFAVLALAVMGKSTMWMAVFADVGVALIAVINALRILK
ncbi:heavy metal translocating P-type ATPase [Clostridium botulinum]|uniref:Zinc-transporting ATPase n=1 Tax=Clostridium botulinum (strain Hall / ATCC 3502 / NCTC 13319 / Type A) TaxID=441771 RepID=A5HZ22_CLOBH|nr:heavy metal translocating P-type ATPase [Clostridium botulinum]EPS50512.1 cadmium-translocating P-type ATPase [Clostridium botulinum CFSAN002369]ABS34776.1 cadmium-translocating P-type ATPase [Clostridium botulinum A str. ATCC 19397]ABS38599.1 cadmium-exporting ATPase [Clostridium botulinum A str. Hall]AWB16402.1 heavy metal translocating P-type ATPase [Clostridium botulinum]AWB29217.1 heavy metal translocating P-type ATPase [Clostridium botulinum]